MELIAGSMTLARFRVWSTGMCITKTMYRLLLMKPRLFKNEQKSNVNKEFKYLKT